MSIEINHDEAPDPSVGRSDTSRAAMPPVLIAVGLSFVLYLALFAFAYADTLTRMIAVWGSAPMFHYGFFILPASLLIGFCLRSRLQAFRPGPYIPALLGICLFGVFWFVARLIAFQTLEYFALIGMVISGIVALIGPGFGRAMVFPLGFLFAMVPLAPIETSLPGLSVAISFAIFFAWLFFKSWRQRAIYLAFAGLLPFMAKFTLSLAAIIKGLPPGNFSTLAPGWAVTALIVVLLLGIGHHFSERRFSDILKEDFNPRPPSHWTNRHVAATLILLALPALLVAMVEG
jgi:transmembrane exosortase EpsH